jgi:LL-diaminopimelate aminotransferase
MAGRKFQFLNTSAASGFVPQVPDFHADVLYICSPNNPTGTCLNKAQLAEFIKYAKEHEAIILFDAAYESFIVDPEFLILFTRLKVQKK